MMEYMILPIVAGVIAGGLYSAWLDDVKRSLSDLSTNIGLALRLGGESKEQEAFVQAIDAARKIREQALAEYADGQFRKANRLAARGHLEVYLALSIAGIKKPVEEVDEDDEDQCHRQ